MLITKRAIHFLRIVIAPFVTSVRSFNTLFTFNFYTLWCLLFYPVIHSFLIFKIKHTTILLEKGWLHLRNRLHTHKQNTRVHNASDRCVENACPCMSSALPIFNYDPASAT